jgi:hypothetical protein
MYKDTRTIVPYVLEVEGNSACSEMKLGFVVGKDTIVIYTLNVTLGDVAVITILRYTLIWISSY